MQSENKEEFTTPVNRGARAKTFLRGLSISSAKSGSSSPSSSRSASPPCQGHSKDPKNIKDTFTKLDVHSKTLLFEANQRLKIFRDRNVQEKEWTIDQTTIYELMAIIKVNLEQMQDISEDMNAIQEQRISSPRVIDQAKTYALAVENLKTSLRQLQRDFQYAINSKERQDLFTLSRSPFDSTNGIRRRAGGATEISSGATESMLNSRRILLDTVQRSAGTIGTLALSSSSIQENQEELKSQNSIISVSKKLLTKYGRREFTDRILICLALVFFLACVVYVVQKRLF